MKKINRIVLSLLLILGLVSAVPVLAQEETPTPEVTETVAPTEIPTAEPTLAPTPAPDPGIPGVDETQVTTWIFVVIVVLVLGIVSIALVGIIQAAKGLPEWAKALLLSSAKTGIDELERIAKGTPTPIDDAAVAELRRRLEEVEGALRLVQQRLG